MNAITTAKRWLFAPLDAPARWWRVILWWELRRIPFNLLIGAYGAICLVLFFWAISTSGRLRPGEDAVEPLALILSPFAANVCYTLGWLFEVPMRILLPDLTLQFSPMLLRFGIVVSLFLVSVPAVAWVGFRLLQLSHVLD